MDDLPRDARAFLNLTRDAHDPPDSPAARQRVHARLVAALAAPPALDALSPPRALAADVSGAAHRVFGWVSSTKLALATTIIALSSGALWALSTPNAPTSPNARTQTQHVEALAPQPSLVPAPAIQPQTANPSPPRTAIAAKRSASSHASARATSPPSLAAETALLVRASSQLSHNDVAGALRSIEQHRRQFGRATQLTEEREGLEALAHCQGQRAFARAEAKRYIERVPMSVLVTRLELACGL